MGFGLGARTPIVAVMVIGAALLACKKNKTTEDRPAAAEVPTPAPTPTAEVPPTPTQTFKLKETAKLDGVTVTLEEFKECKLENVYSRRALSRKKNKLVGVLALFEGNYEKQHLVSFSNFKATDPEGLTYRSTTRSGSDCFPTLKSSQLANGDKTKGWVLFEVPEKMEKVTVSYNNRRPYRRGLDPNDREQRAKFEVN